MLNVSWAKKRAEFVFVFAIGDTVKGGKSEAGDHNGKI